MARRRSRVPPLLRLAMRVAGTLAACTVIALGTREFVVRIGENIALARELARTQHDVRSLQAQRAEDAREIRRLQQPQGVVPYIYRRLRMVRPGQTLIYVVGTPTPDPDTQP
jgi:cell division protein FtsB